MQRESLRCAVRGKNSDSAGGEQENVIGGKVGGVCTNLTSTSPSLKEWRCRWFGVEAGWNGRQIKKAR